MLTFPNPVNELAARTVAGGVLLLSLTTLALSTLDHRWLWLTAVLAYGFVARVLSGPTLSPLGQLATRVVAPRLGEARLVPGPPKRFAQTIGAVVTGSAVVLVATGHAGSTQVLLLMMVVFAALESLLGYCVGCTVFGWLMRRGVIPAETCEACNDLSLVGAR